jgi:hypothetical protein
MARVLGKIRRRLTKNGPDEPLPGDADVKYLQENPGFDDRWYVSQDPATAKFAGGPIAHFCRLGWREGRDPNPWFSTAYYLRTNPDLVDANVNPFVHYTSVGWREGRMPTSWFSPSDYLAANPDLKAEGVEPFWHYVSSGRAEGRPLRPPVDPIEESPFAGEANWKYLCFAEELIVSTTMNIEKALTKSDRSDSREMQAYLHLLKTINETVQGWLAERLSDA